MLRAMRRAARHQRFSKKQIDDLSCNNAERLVNSTWKDLTDALGAKTLKRVHSMSEVFTGNFKASQRAPRPATPANMKLAPNPSLSVS